MGKKGRELASLSRCFQIARNLLMIRKNGDYRWTFSLGTNLISNYSYWDI